MAKRCKVDHDDNTLLQPSTSVTVLGKGHFHFCMLKHLFPLNVRVKNFLKIDQYLTAAFLGHPVHVTQR